MNPDRRAEEPSQGAGASAARLAAALLLSAGAALCSSGAPMAAGAADVSAGQKAADSPTAEGLAPLSVEEIAVQGLKRRLRLYRPATLAEPPALVVALHGAGGDGERLRRLTGGAFERVADRHGFLLAYPDALGGRWSDCRARAPYRSALAGIDDLAFLRAVAQRAEALAGRPIEDRFLVGYSNGGHLIFRALAEAPESLAAAATIGAQLPVAEENACPDFRTPVPILLVAGTLDPVVPWSGGAVRTPLGDSPGRVRSAAETARVFRELARLPERPEIERLPDLDPADGTRVEIRRWGGAGGPEVVLTTVAGGGHSLPHPTAPFPTEVVGPTSRDLDGAAAIWAFFERHRKHDGRGTDRQAGAEKPLAAPGGLRVVPSEAISSGPVGAQAPPPPSSQSP